MRRPALILGTLIFAGVLAGSAAPAKAGWSISIGTSWRSGYVVRTFPRYRVRSCAPLRRYHRPAYRVRYVTRRPCRRVVRTYRPVTHRRVVRRVYRR